MKHPTDEEIEKAASEHSEPIKGPTHSGFAQHDFIVGAKWARDQQPKLKTLEWRTSFRGDGRGSFSSADTPFITYEVTNDDALCSWGISGFATRICDNVDHGKQLAQADYENRVNKLYAGSN